MQAGELCASLSFFGGTYSHRLRILHAITQLIKLTKTVRAETLITSSGRRFTPFGLSSL